MRTLTASELISIWSTQGRSTVSEQVLSLLSAASPDTDWHSLTALTLGERDRRLMHLRQMMFGAAVDAIASCPACDEQLDINFDTSVFQREDVPGPAPPLEFIKNGYRVAYRNVTVGDLAALPVSVPLEDAKSDLMHRCILGARLEDNPIPIEALPSEIVAAVIETISDRDPGADIQFDVHCPACGHAWLTDFDIGAFFLKELDTEVRSLLADVHRIASTYGWAEKEILDMDPVRRRYYLEMIMNG